jgi:hypothetical protein
MFIPAGKLIVALIWAFWMMGVDSSLGREHYDTEEPIQKIIKVTEENIPNIIQIREYTKKSFR